MWVNKLINLIACLFIFNLSFVEIIGVNDENDLRLTLAEKNTLKEFKSQVSGELKEDFMNSEFYLIRWLRTTNFNIEAAKQLLIQNISWREQNNITTILDEDFSDLEQDYHLRVVGNDKQGRPVVEVDLGDWDLRAAVLQGKIKRLHRYLTSYTERSIKAVYAAQQQGKPVTRYVVLFDFDGLNLRQHGCPACLSFLMQWISEFDRFYPYFTNEDIFINAPPIGRILLNTVRVVTSPDLNSRLKVFDSNKAIWMKYLDERIDKNQRSSRYGGTSTKV